MASLLRNWRVLLLIILLVLAIFTIGFKGLRFGIDFKGGTMFQVHLAEEVESPEEMSRIVSTLSQRLDWTGLKDTKVASWGQEFILVQIAATDAETVERIEALLKKQGKFEVMLDGNVIFTGDDIVEIPRSATEGYGFLREGDLIQYSLPFTLRHDAAVRFTQATFHKCSIVSYDPQTGAQYDCEKTYFFIDRPTNAILVIPEDQYFADRDLMLTGNPLADIPEGTIIDEVLSNAQVSQFVIEDNNISSEQLASLAGIVGEKELALVPADLSEEIKAELEGLGFKLKVVEAEETVPWTWAATGAKQVISLSSNVANMDIARVEDAEIMSKLRIEGSAATPDQAQKRLNDMTVLLESGTLLVPVESISRETISPLLGENFLFNVALMGIAALVTVAIVIFIRYRVLKLTIPIMITGFSEVVLILGFASAIGWNLDLAAVAGILAAVGTGVDNQIIITDEMMRGGIETETSLSSRIKRAFFIIMATASTVLAAMAPIVLFGFGLGKLVGFAITTISGVLIGVLITRPAFGEIAKVILEK